MQAPFASGPQIVVRFKRLGHGEGLPLPDYQSEGASGVDLIAAVPEAEPVVLQPNERTLIPTGLEIELPRGYEGQVRPRSGLALKHGITVLNTPGTIDADYRGELKVILINLGMEPFQIDRGERIAQLVVQPVIQARIESARELSRTDRNSGGFGSTGSAA